MLTKILKPSLAAALLTMAVPGAAVAQTMPGTRAAGMAGAFVAVADDASAVYWNPAGVATGSFVSAIVQIGRQVSERPSQQLSTNQRDTAGMVALSATAFGLAYYRRAAYGTPTAGSAVAGAPSREDLRRSVQAVTTSTLGAAVVHSLTEHLVVGATPKFVHGADGLAFDVDAGAMLWVNRFRLGVAARNLAAPSFDGEAGEVELDREVTVGAAWGSGWSGVSRVIVSVDGDLTGRVTPSGERRDLAAGVETWWLAQRLGVRSGLRTSTIGEARVAIAAGVSAGLTPGMLLEAHVMRGRSDDRGWSIGARLSF